ncbi:cytochrome P450 [Streptomyces sp. NPDC059373]
MSTDQSPTGYAQAEEPQAPPEVDSATLRALIEKFSVHSRVSLENHEAIYREMRESCPVARSSSHGGFYALSRYRDVYDAAHKPDMFSSFPVTIPPFGNPVPMIPIEMDPPVHRKYRTLVGAQFSPNSVDANEPKLRGIVSTILDGIEGRSQADLAEEVAIAVPLRAIFEVYLGVPQKDWAMLKREFLYLLEPDPDKTDEENTERAMEAGLNCTMYFAELLEERRTNGFGDDLISHLAQAELDGQRLTDDEIFGFCLVLVPAGFDTTASLLSRLLLIFAEQPDVRERLEQVIDDPDKLDLAVEELVRFIPPQPGVARNVTAATTFADTELTEGDRLLLLWPSANRDPEEFPNPDELVFDRQPNRHLGFGSGIHRCLGSHLARLEIKILLQEFLRRVPRYRVAPGEQPLWHTGNTWGVTRLPVAFENWGTAAAGAGE